MSHCGGQGNVLRLVCIRLLRHGICQSFIANMARLCQLGRQPVMLRLPHSFRLLQEGLLHLCVCTYHLT